MLDVDRLAEAVLAGTRALIAKELAPLREENAALRLQNDALAKRIEAVEARPEPVIPVGLTLDDVTVAAWQVAAEEIAKALETYDATAREALQSAIAAIPEPKPVDVKAALAAVEADVARLQERLEALPVEPQHGTDGRGVKAASITASGDLSLAYTDGTEKIIGRVRGADADPAEVQRIKETVAELRGWKDAIRIPDAIPGKDGRGIAGAKVNDDGELILKFTDGDTQSLGRVRGEDGANGFDLNALAVEFDGERTLSFAWPDGTRKDFNLPTPIYRGVWKEGTYQRGDTVTWGGSQFTAIADTDAKPETDGTWRLSVKRGRDGAEVVKAERKTAPVKVGGGDAG